MTTRIGWLGGSLGLALALAACGNAGPALEETEPPRGEGSAVVEPSESQQEWARITAAWSATALEVCGPALRNVLGTGELVEGALAGVDDPEGRAADEIEDAKRWIGEADMTLTSIRPDLETGTCNDEVKTALDQTWQYYVKAGTAAIQAGQIVGS